MTEANLDNYFGVLRKLGLLLHRSWHSVKRKPIIGGSFMTGRYSIASLVHYDAALYEVSYYLLDEDSRLPLSCADSKGEAVSLGRNLLLKHPVRVREQRALLKQEIAEYERRMDLMAEKTRAEIAATAVDNRKVKSIPRRRKQIFDADGGQCHYCSTPLTLDGKWHIEHKMPKALGGGNEPGNLVASCVSCNHKKRDTTDVEFKAKLARGAA